jgi:hypothetical protein
LINRSLTSVRDDSLPSFRTDTIYLCCQKKRLKSTSTSKGKIMLFAQRPFHTRSATFLILIAALFGFSSGSVQAQTENCAVNCAVVASSVEKAGYEPSKAVDANTTTRWSSAFSDPQWIYVNLGNKYSISRVKLDWEAANAKNYLVQGSNDASTWITMVAKTNMAAGNHRIDDLTGLSGTYQYIRINGTTRNTIYGYSLFELEVYGTLSVSYQLTTTVNPSGAGTVTATPSGSSFPSGTTVSLNATPTTAYTFANWSGDASGTANPVTITMNSNKAITANFTLKTYTISASAGTGGTIAPAGSVIVNHGANQSFLFTPNSGNIVDIVTVDGSSIGSPTSYTFPNVTTGHNINVTFKTGTAPPLSNSEKLSISGDLWLGSRLPLPGHHQNYRRSIRCGYRRRQGIHRDIQHRAGHRWLLYRQAW